MIAVFNAAVPPPSPLLLEDKAEEKDAAGLDALVVSSSFSALHRVFSGRDLPFYRRRRPRPRPPTAAFCLLPQSRLRLLPPPCPSSVIQEEEEEGTGKEEDERDDDEPGEAAASSDGSILSTEAGSTLVEPAPGAAPSPAPVGPARKPKWAMTAAEASAAEEEEVGALLAFVEDLDFSKYVADLEVRSMVQAVAARVEALDAAAAEEEAAEAEEEEEREDGQPEHPTMPMLPPAAPSSSAVLVRPSRSGGGHRHQAQQQEQDPVGWANAVLAGDDADGSRSTRLGSIHSVRSLSQLLRRRLLLLPTASPSPAPPAVPPAPIDSEEASLAPRIVVIDEEEGLRRRRATGALVNVSRLPYLHRHPSI